MPTFFMPLVAPEKAEAAYADMAAHCHSRVPPPNERIYSITFKHDRVTWTATVGEQLRGEEYVTVRTRGARVERTKHHHDNATVLAIFEGDPFDVFHDNARSVWQNPFMAGRPTRIVKFEG